MADSLDPEIKAVLKKILSKDPNDFTDYDKAFLRARISYIGKKELEKLADYLDESKSEKKAREARERAASQAKEDSEEQSRHDINEHLGAEEVVDEDEEEDDEAVG